MGKIGDIWCRSAIRAISNWILPAIGAITALTSG